jgi:eukaryotic-like serine/threonine-protein kinase
MSPRDPPDAPVNLEYGDTLVSAEETLPTEVSSRDGESRSTFGSMLLDDLDLRVVREARRRYREGLRRMLIIGAVAYPLFGLVELIGVLGAESSRSLLLIAGVRFGFAALLLLAAFLVGRRPNKVILVGADLLFMIGSGLLLGGLAAVATDTEAGLYFAGLSVLAFSRVLLVQGDRRLAAAVILSSWFACLAAYLLFRPPLTPDLPGSGWAWFAGVQVMVAIDIALALAGATMLTRLHEREARARSKERYRFREVMGRGGFSTVYMGWDSLLERRCAIKVLDHAWKDHQELLRRYEREVLLTSNLVSPHAVRVFDFGCTREGRLYYVMEYLEGRDLGQIIKEQGPLELSRALRWAVQTAEALDEVHRAGSAHLDIKPDNIFVVGEEPHSLAKVLDFGLARALVEPGSERAKGEGVEGTPGFIAPERINNEHGDGRADIYGLGAVLFYLLTGRGPYQGNHPLNIIMRQAT